MSLLRLQTVPPSSWEGLSLGEGPWRRVELGGGAAGAGADGGQGLLAAVQEGGVVGALWAAVVAVGLPAWAPPALPVAAQDPDEGLQTGSGGGCHLVTLYKTAAALAITMEAFL